MTVKKSVRAAAWLAALLCTAIFLAAPAQAASAGVLEHNLEISHQWVNWYPSGAIWSGEVERLARQLRLQAGDRSALPRVVHDWVCGNISYDWDAFRSETYGALHPDDVLRERRGVCESIANLVQALLLDSEVPCIKVQGVCVSEGTGWTEQTAASTRVTHTWNEFYMDGRWITMDCTMDMRNRYEDGIFTLSPGISDYFDPEEAFFAQTHKRLYRGFDLPENIPSPWAVPGIQRAVDLGLVPLSMLSQYHQPVSAAQFYALLGLEGGEDAPLTRLQAAVLLDTQEQGRSAALPYEDTGGCLPEEQAALAALRHRGIMAGTAPTVFSPDRELTRQEAILIALRLAEEVM